MTSPFKRLPAWLLAATVGFGVASGVQGKSVDLPKIPNRTVSILDFGGKGDGVSLNTDAFEAALAALEQKGGGKLDVPPGIWLTGPIHLRSRINLCVERGALIKFSPDPKLYPLVLIDVKGEREVDSTSPISGQDLNDVAITGGGVIDGSGDAWRPIKRGKMSDAEWKALIKSGGVVNDKGDGWWPSREAMEGEPLVKSLREKASLNLADYEPAHQFLRPRMVRLIGCRKVLLQDVTVQNPPNWTLNPELCNYVSILNVKVHNSPAAQNSDALDLESCRHALIRDCIFDAGDDGICLKSGKDAAGRRIGVPTEDVQIEGCIVYHAHGGFTIGSEMSGGVRDVWVNNCLFMGTEIGLRFKSTRGRGGVVENIQISHVSMVDLLSDVINFDMFYGGKAPTDETADGGVTNALPAVDEGTPQFKDIHIDHVTCRGAQNAIVLEGLPEMPIRDIYLNDVSISARRGVSVIDAEGIHFDHVQVNCQSGPLLTQVRVKNSTLDLVK